LAYGNAAVTSMRLDVMKLLVVLCSGPQTAGPYFKLLSVSPISAFGSPTGGLTGVWHRGRRRAESKACHRR